jgi:hypothetical protein
LLAGHCIQNPRLHGADFWFSIKGNHRLILALITPGKPA